MDEPEAHVISFLSPVLFTRMDIGPLRFMSDSEFWAFQTCPADPDDRYLPQREIVNSPIGFLTMRLYQFASEMVSDLPLDISSTVGTPKR
jgi:hypothetical protein